MSNAKALKSLAASVADNALADLGDFGAEVSLLAQRVLAQQVLVLTEGLAGKDTTLADAALKATYQNLAVAGSAKTAKEVNGAFKEFLTAAVGIAFEAAGLPTAAKAVKKKATKKPAKLVDPEG